MTRVINVEAIARKMLADEIAHAARIKAERSKDPLLPTGDSSAARVAAEPIAVDALQLLRKYPEAEHETHGHLCSPGEPRYERLRASIAADGVRDPLMIMYAVADAPGRLATFSLHGEQTQFRPTDPVLVDGHHRLAIARELGIRFVDCYVWTNDGYRKPSEVGAVRTALGLPEALP